MHGTDQDLKVLASRDGPCTGGYRSTSPIPKQEIYGLDQSDEACGSVRPKQYRRRQSGVFPARSGYRCYSRRGILCWSFRLKLLSDTSSDF